MKNILYIKYNKYYKTGDKKIYYSNRLLTIGILKWLFGFKLYFNFYL